MNPILIPPGVCGRVRGSISITIDEVFWTGNTQEEVYVKFSWWGSDDLYEFYPKDLTKVTAKSAKSQVRNDQSSSFTFPVGTSIRFLENYFQKWKCLTFNVYRISDKRFLGCARVENWECILSDRSYGSYFAVSDKKGNRIGDLHIVFCLKMKKKKYKLKSDFPVDGSEVIDRAGDENSKLSDLLTKGQELRKAMVSSVLSTCDTKDLDEIVTTEVQPPAASIVMDNQSEAKLVDFLMGKELTEPEKEIAMNTLRCTSPNSILEMAATLSDNTCYRDMNKAPVFEDAYRKKFCSVGEKTNDGAFEYKSFSACSDNHRDDNKMSIGDVPCQVPAPASNRIPDANPIKSNAGEPFTRVREGPVNSYKITFGLLTLTALGLKKVSTSPTIKPLNNKVWRAKSPGIVFSIETVLPFAPNCKASFMKPVTVSSKAFGGNDVVFNDSIVQKFRRSKEPAWLKVRELISGLPIRVYWRCLNQRLPSLLGQCLIPDELVSNDLESSFRLTVYMANKQVAGTLACKIELGAGIVFGNELLGNMKKKKATRLESMLPELSESVPSIVSDKSLSQEYSKESFAYPPPPPPPVAPPASRCITASSGTSANYREPVESDIQLITAITSLNEKLSKKSVQDQQEKRDDMDEVRENEKNAPLSARSGGPKTTKTSAEAGPKKEDGRTCQNKSPRRGCCCCCRGCPGDCKRKKSLRRKPLRDKKHPAHRGSSAQHDDSTPVSISDGGMSPGDRERLDELNAYLRRSQFHSPPTKLNSKSRIIEQTSRARDTFKHPKRLDDEFRDDRSRSFVKSRVQHLPNAYADDVFKQRSDLVGDDKYVFRAPGETPSVHRFSVNVYSSDAQIFYREGELELFMVYRFPQVDPVSVFCPSKISCLELSGDAAPVTHHLPLRSSLSEALLSYSKQNITFHIWARAYLYEKKDFLIGQAKLPLEKLVEWEAAHVYSQKRRDCPLLPPDKHFINLRIHPSKGELPQHLEPGRIAQLGLEIDYEKFRDVGNPSIDSWPTNLDPRPDGFYQTSKVREEMTDFSDPYFDSSKQELNHKTTRWEQSNQDCCQFQSTERPGKWGVRVMDSYNTDPVGSRLPQSSRVNDNCRTGLGNSENVFTPITRQDKALDPGEDEEFMLILGGRDDPNLVSRGAFDKMDSHCAPPSAFRSPDGYYSTYPYQHVCTCHANCHNGTWASENLQFQSLSRLDPANTTEFAPDAECLQRFQSPCVDRDFPPGVKTAEFLSDNNSECNVNPFEASVTVHPPPKTKQPIARMRIDAESSPLPSLAKVIDSSYRTRDISPVQNLDSSFDLGSESKATQTTVNGLNELDLFSVRIEIEAAINLPSQSVNGVATHPSSRVEFNAWSKGKEIIVQSSVINDDSNPKYDSAWNVELPAHFLYKGESEFELRVVNVDDGTISSAFIDLTTLSAGLPCIEGWYFLSSHGHKSAGQVKVTITPTENIRKYRDDWIEECRKRKKGFQRCKDERVSCESAQRMMLNDSSSTKFKEKMKELEQLTERMKQKLLDAEHWDANSPCTLMREVDQFAKQLIQESKEPCNNQRKSNESETTSQGLPELDMRTVREMCPVENEYHHDLHPKTSAASTFDDSPTTFTCYAPVSRIRKPCSAARSCSRSINNRVNFFSDDLIGFSGEYNPNNGSKSPIDLISFSDSPDEHRSQTYSLPLNSNDTSPTSPVNVLIGEKFDDSDDSARIIGRNLSLDKCHEELERLPKDSLDAASIAIEQIIADLRKQKIDDSNS